MKLLYNWISTNPQDLLQNIYQTHNFLTLHAIPHSYHTHTTLIPHAFHTSSTLILTHSTLIPHLFHTYSTLIPHSIHTHSTLIPHSCHNHSTLIPHSFHAISNMQKVCCLRKVSKNFFAKLVQSVSLCHRLSKKLNFIKI